MRMPVSMAMRVAMAWPVAMFVGLPVTVRVHLPSFYFVLSRAYGFLATCWMVDNIRL